MMKQIGDFFDVFLQMHEYNFRIFIYILLGTLLLRYFSLDSIVYAQGKALSHVSKFLSELFELISTDTQIKSTKILQLDIESLKKEVNTTKNLFTQTINIIV